MTGLPSSILKQARAAAAENPGAIISVYDTFTQTCCYASRSHATITGYQPAQMIGLPWTHFVTASDHSHAALAGTDALLNGQSVEFGFHVDTKNGRRTPMRGTAWIVADHKTDRPY